MISDITKDMPTFETWQQRDKFRRYTAIDRSITTDMEAPRHI